MTVRKDVRQQAESALRATFTPGSYFNEDSTFLLNNLFTIYNSSLQSVASFLCNSATLSYLSQLYERIDLVSNLYKSNLGSSSLVVFWEEKGALYRQTIDYLLETILQSSDNITTDVKLTKEHSILFDYCWEFARQSIVVSNWSNFHYMLASPSSGINLLEPGSDAFLEDNLDQSDIEVAHYTHRISANSKKHIIHRNQNSLDFTDNLSLYTHLLDNSFQTSLGFSFSFLYHFLSSDFSSELLELYKPSMKSDFPVIIPRELFLEFLQLKGLSSTFVEVFLSGLSLTHINLKDNPREIWQTTAEFRLGRRPLFSFTMTNVVYLAYSPSRLTNYLALLMAGLPFNQLPRNWKTPIISKALARLSNQAGNWFENLTASELAKLNIVGGCYSSSIAYEKDSILIPSEVGEIDYIGYSHKERILYVLECKYLSSSFSPRNFRNELSAFIKGKKSYVNQLSRKTNWVRENREQILDIMLKLARINSSFDRSSVFIYSSFITYYNAFPSAFLSPHNCETLFSLTESIKKRIK